MKRLPFREIWAIDFEFHTHNLPGNKQVPICLVAKELRSGQIVRVWQKEILTLRAAPFNTGKDSLVIAYFASAEIHCFCSLGWSLPENLIDCFAEFRVLTNGLSVPRGKSLLGAMTWFRLSTISAEEKTAMRDLILSGGPWNLSQQMAILDYCQTDVDALGELFPALIRALGDREHWLIHAQNRGNYSMAVGLMEFNGIPIDVSTLDKMKANWDEIRKGLVREIAQEFPVFDGLKFKSNLFREYLRNKGLKWPLTQTGALALDRESFRQQVKQYPELAPLKEVRDNLANLRLAKLQIGEDGRNRALLSPFAAKTGRNLPSNAKFIFGPSAWLRALIKPPKGRSIVYLDYSSQEIAIAAVLSEDRAMAEGYTRGDPYLDFAIRAGLAPPTATKDSHKAIRQMCKQVVLGVQYGMQAESLAARIGEPLYKGQQLLRAHKESYPVYWKWVSELSHHCRAVGYIDTVFGWRKFINESDSDTALQNFPCQANGAEMLRLACTMAHQAGLKIIAPVHDAILLESPIETLDKDVLQLQNIMIEAGRIILDGFSIRVETDITTYPNRYMDDRGVVMWEKVQRLVRL